MCVTDDARELACEIASSRARAGGGCAESIYSGERIEPKVLRQFARLLSPALTDVREGAPVAERGGRLLPGGQPWLETARQILRN